MSFSVLKSIVSASVLSGLVSVSATADTMVPFSFDFSYPSTSGAVEFIDPAPASFGNHISDQSHINGYPYASAIRFTEDDLSVTVEGGVVRPRDTGRNPSSSSDTFQGGRDGVYVGQFHGGLGVGFEINPGDIDDGNHTVDDRRGRDFLVLSFDHEVWIQALDFDYFYPRYYADIQVYENGITGTLLYTARIPFPGGLITLPGEGLRGDTFVIAPAIDGRTDQFKLRAVHGHVVAVPTPTAAVGCFAMLGLMGGGLGRRRRASA